MVFRPPMDPSYRPSYNNSITLTRQVAALHQEVVDLTEKLEALTDRVEVLEKK